MDKDLCQDCGNPLTTLFSSKVCDWCDGLVADEWDKTKEVVTEEIEIEFDLISFAYFDPISDYLIS